ncbi:hypothetical protein [Microbacterium sp.]|jgi:hypothetical protein|uniref:hypothetical protein n=1 Tax=Microbacterium sp. TaxID=51671 RepID=UPI0037C951E6
MHGEQWPADTGCPRWCNGEHEQSEPCDTSHRSDPWLVPAVERRAGPDGRDFDRVASTDLTVGIESRWGDTWVWITPEDSVRRSIILSKESAQRLHRMLTTIFGDVAM